MINVLAVLAFLTFVFWLGYHVMGALLTITIWLFIKLTIAMIIGFLGLVCCISILLIPIGLKCIKLAWNVIV